MGMYTSRAQEDSFFDSNDQKKVLIVDDSIASGSALNEAKDSVAHLSDTYEMEFCVVYATPEKKSMATSHRESGNDET